MSLLQTDRLTKRFGSVTAVDGLTVDVSRGRSTKRDGFNSWPD